MKPIRTRFAPSPTGYAHLGFVSRLLINYALSRSTGGQLVWRNEDTDQERFVEGALEFNMKWMHEFGLDWDEGPDKGGPHAPYNQSERLDMYRESADRLVDKGHAYRCFCTQERLDELRRVQQAAGLQTGYDGKCRELSDEEIEQKLAANQPFTIRLKVPKGQKINFVDAITHNKISWDSSEIQDAILMKSDGFPTYHLAVVVDDVDMEIDYAFRGSEWIASTPLHMLIYDGLEIPAEKRPQIGHFTVILDPETNKKFSKRRNSFRINGLVYQGYMVEAILNYLMLLGWAPKDDREIFSLQEFVDNFDLAGMQKADPTWNQKKMDWFNGVYMRNLDIDQYRDRLLQWIDKFLLQADVDELAEAMEKLPSQVESLRDLARQMKAQDEQLLHTQLKLVQERAISFSQVMEQLMFFYEAPTEIDLDIKQLKRVRGQYAQIRADIYELLSGFGDDTSKWQHEKWEQGMRDIGDKHGVKHGDVFMVMRVAVCGSPFSPPLFESLQLLGKDTVLQRLA